MLSTSAFSKELAFALDICEQAGVVALRYFNEGTKATLKYDGSPVTVADTECERIVRQAIETRYPQDEILGEEEGQTPGQVMAGQKARRWIIDPIDGTYGFVRGLPIFSTLLALEQDGEIILGVVHAPAEKETFWAQTGQGAWRNGQRLAVSSNVQMSEAQFNFGCLSRIFAKGLGEPLRKVSEMTKRQRSPGDYRGFAEVFQGKAEANLEIGVKPWDLAPMKIITMEAGGVYADLAGGKSIYTGDCLISNRDLYENFLKTLSA